jgi:CheY-like chemotaxis protein
MTTWMVVEDEPELYDMVLTMYEMLGIDGVAFTDGEEAVSWIEEVDGGQFQQEIPELALLDIRLPGKINGPMVGERLRKSPHMNGMAIVLMTAYKLTPQQEKAFIEQAGCNLFLYKPLPGFEKFRTMLENLVAKPTDGKHSGKGKTRAAKAD